MLTIKQIRDDKEAAARKLAKKGVDAAPVIEKIISFDDRRKALQLELDNTLAAQNKAAKEIGALMGQGRREEAEELVALIPTISVEPFHTGRLQELSEHYRSILGTHSTTDLVEIIKSVYSKKREAEAAGRRVSQMDDRYMKLAEELLHGELSVALEIPKDEVKDYIHRRVAEAEAAG